MTRCNCPQCQPVTGDCPAATELTDMEAQLAAVQRTARVEANLRVQWQRQCAETEKERDTALAALAQLQATPAPGAAAGAVHETP